MSDRERLLLDILLRTLAALSLGFFAIRAASLWWAEPARITLLLLMLTEGITVILVIVSRKPLERDWNPLGVLITLGATFYFLALSLESPIRLAPEWLAATLQCVGFAWQIFAKLSLGRSFGLLPANRGAVTRGAYRLVRHPIYLGYLVTHLGFLAANFGLRNLLVIIGLYAMQLARIAREESLLRGQESYRDYCRSVRYRLVPYVY